MLTEKEKSNVDYIGTKYGVLERTALTMGSKIDVYFEGEIEGEGLKIVLMYNDSWQAWNGTFWQYCDTAEIAVSVFEEGVKKEKLDN